jgi:hypothetical protein
MNFSRALGRGIVEVAYGEKMLNLIGDELLSWNGEAMHLHEESFFKFWLVDIFNFCSLMLLCLGTLSFLISTQCISYRAGFQAPASGVADPQILIQLLMPVLERSVTAPAG